MKERERVSKDIKNNKVGDLRHDIEQTQFVYPKLS